MKCLLGARFSMTAEILGYQFVHTPVSTDVVTDVGQWTGNQDPITGEIITDWQPGVQDNPVTDTIDETITGSRIAPCFVRGVYNVATRGGMGEEIFGEEYVNSEHLNMWLPADVRISKRDRVTNIKDRTGNIVFLDEEYQDRPTVYNVQRVTPRFDAWNKMTDQMVLLEKIQ